MTPPGTSLPDGWSVRDVTDADAAALIRLIGAIYAEYPGCVLDLPGVDADLTAPRTTIDEKRGRWLVVEDRQGMLVACVGWAPTDAVDDGPAVELKRLYVAPSARRRGLGGWLVEQVRQAARQRDAQAIVAWSDDRFTDAHRLYEREGFVRQPETRDLHDPSDTTELRFLARL